METAAQTKKSGLSVNEVVILLIVVSAFVSVFFLGALILLLPFYALFSRQGKKLLPAKKSDWILLAFATSALISTLLFAKEGLVNDFYIQPYFLYALGVGIIILAFDIFFFVAIMTKKAFYYGLRLMAVLSIGSFAISVIQTYFEIYPDPLSRPGRVASTFMNENYYGMMIEFVTLIALFLLFKSKGKISSQVFYVLVFSINVAALWLCKSRMAFIIVAITTLIYLFFEQGKKSFFVLLVILALCLLVIKIPSFLPRFDSASTSISFDYRFEIWGIALSAFLKNPLLGRGYYSYSAIWREGETEIAALHSHNLYIEILINFGIIGFLLLASFCFIRAFQTCKACYRSSLKSELALMISICAAVIIHGLADITIFWPQTGFVVVYLLTCTKVFEETEPEKIK